MTGDQNRFNPDGYISRAEMATMLHRALNLDRPLSSPDFPDGADRLWARDAIETLAGYGVLRGLPGQRGPVFAPDQLSSVVDMVGVALGDLKKASNFITAQAARK